MVFGSVASAAWAHFDTGMYTHSDCPAPSTNRVDPINFVFYDWGTFGRVVNSIETHTAWDTSSGTSQTFVSHGVCSDMSGQQASGSIFVSRYHIRLRLIHFDDGPLGWTTVGDAHHEDLVVPCGHAVDENGPNGSGFDQGRNQLRTHMVDNANHSFYSTWWGNTQNMRQCDGDYARSDGSTTFLHIHQDLH